jgi:plastocyanin
MTRRVRTHPALPLLLAALAGALALVLAAAIADTARGGTRAGHPASVRHASARHSPRRRPCRRTRVHHRRRARARCHRAPAKKPSAKAHTKAPVAAGPPASGGVDGTPPTSSPGVYPASGGAVPAPPGAGSPEPAPPSVPHVQVTAVEYGLTLSRSSVPAGKVVLELVNRGQDEHNLNAAPPEGPPTASIANTASGGVVDETIEMRPGSYTLFCSLPGHEQKGMKATLVVH